MRLRSAPPGPGIHHAGFVPTLTGGKDLRQPLPSPDLLILKETEEGFFLERHTLSGQYAGDIWHRDLEEAKEQAGWEYGPRITGWQSVPEGQKDPLEYLMRGQET